MKLNIIVVAVTIHICCFLPVGLKKKGQAGMKFTTEIQRMREVCLRSDNAWFPFPDFVFFFT